ncbi:putative endo-beta-1,4-glucanase B [Lachnellula hyalina]|uniref:cellulase n=1 Tax=Lachnellula hyalina TaxID=1316788 RepID=A0A8H8QV24_9HELO|nr:putative endo-beta-1,4-glucanase B [Lachnellula hyalina]TVY23338.1 putative endo-beta-1,4-glucanase B [Lachnellula hyalina]
MRFSKTFLAAGFTASVFAAPIPDEDNGECYWEPEETSSALAVVASSTSASLVASSVSTSAAASLAATKAVTSASVASSVSTSVAASLAATKAVTSASVATSSPSSTAATAAVTTSAVASSSSSASSASSTGALEWLGVNESGAEFGTGNIPGVLGTDYTWPLTASIQTLMDKGMNIFRIPFLMERLAQGTITASLDATYLADLKTIVSFITAAGGHAVIDPHNYGRYSGSIITSTSDFQTFWQNVATEFASDSNVVFDCNNEFHDMPSNTLVAELNQACIDGVRAAGATTQYVFVEGTSYTGAWTWVSSGNADAMVGLTDPSDKIVYEMHQYLDSDGSGTSDTCVSSTIGSERIAAATAWLKANNKKGILGEFAGGANSVCETAVTGLVDALTAASDVWMGAMWWGGGPWWAEYIFSMEPPSGTGYTAYIDTLAKYI